MSRVHTIRCVVALFLGTLAANGMAHAADTLEHRVEQAATAAALASVHAPDRFEVVSARFGGAAPVAGDALLELLETRGPNAAGMVQVVFRLSVDGIARGEARATVRGRVLGPVLQTAGTLKQGEVIAAVDLQLAENDLTRLTQLPLRDPAQAVGRVPVRTLGKGRVLTASLLAPAPIVHRGETIDLTFGRDRLSVVVEAIALSDGAPREIVSVKNSVTGAIVRGRVQSDGSVALAHRKEERHE